MRLATLRDGSRDGTLIVVDHVARRFARATTIASSLQAGLDDWDRVEPALRALAEGLDADPHAGEPLVVGDLSAPLPRAFEWIDGSSYLNHILMVRRARGVEPPPNLQTDPILYQGGSGVLVGAEHPLRLPDVEWGLDFEAELAVILGDVARGTTRAQAASRVRLIALVNDVTYRNLVPAELAKGFGFLQSKPATAFSPLVATPDELGPAFRDGRVHVRLRSTYNGERIGDVDTGPEMHFSFFDLIAHVARTRALTAGTILGGGTVSNQNRARGVSCLVERRTLETLDNGAPRTPYMKPGDTVRIEAFDDAGRSVFGAIDQRVVAG
jgi:fumarylacetoacetate (FAA) hydrolase